jgi:hypothetical protein
VQPQDCQAEKAPALPKIDPAERGQHQTNGPEK